MIVNASETSPSGGDEHNVAYDFMPVAVLSVLHEQADRETGLSYVKHRLKRMGVEPDETEAFVTETLVENGLASLESDGTLATTADGTNYLAERTDWIEGTYAKDGNKRRFPSTMYQIMNFARTEAGSDGWVTSGDLLQRVAEAIGATKRETAGRRIVDLRRDGIVETEPKKTKRDERLKRLRLKRHGEARLEAMRRMFAKEIAKMEGEVPDVGADFDPGEDPDINSHVSRLSPVEVKANIEAVSDEIEHMREELERMAPEELNDLPNNGTTELDGLNERDKLAALTLTMRDLEARLTRRQKQKVTVQ